MKVGLMLPGIKGQQKAEESRLAMLFKDLKNEGIQADLILYNNNDVDKIETECSVYDIILVWVNPIHQGTDRTVLDNMLRRLSSSGIKVATHPEIILKIGTKDILYTSQNMDWGCETFVYRNYEDFMTRFPESIKSGVRVLKQYRGNGGNGVWKVKIDADNSLGFQVLHAARGSLIQKMSQSQFYESMLQYFEHDGHLIDQEFQSRVVEGMTRVYMSLDKVIGFGHQFVTALIDPPSDEPLIAQPRLYYDNTKTEFQQLKTLLETKWIAELQELLNIGTNDLPLLWDADFLLGPKHNNGNDTYVLCEINVSSVYPYPEVGNSIIITNIKELLNL